MLKHDAKKAVIFERSHVHSMYFKCIENVVLTDKKKTLIKALKSMEIFFELNDKSICRGL